MLLGSVALPSDHHLLGELLGDGGAGDPTNAICDRDEAARVRSAVAALGGRERRIVELRYGIDGDRSRTLVEIAEELGVSPQRVRGLEARSLRALAAQPELCALRAAA